MMNGVKNGIIGCINTMKKMLELNSFFATPVARLHEPIMAASLLKTARQILDDRDNLTNPWGYDCTYGTRIETHPDLDTFKSWTYNVANKFFNEIGFDSSLVSFTPEIFLSEIFEGEYHPKHTHPNSKVSGILYLQTPPGSAKLRLHDPRPFRDFVDYPRLNDKDYDFIDLEVQAGVGYVWPAWVAHEVLVNKSGDKGRIAIVFNM